MKADRVPDGRTKRADDRRKKIMETLLAFYRENNFAPSIKELTERSQVSRRTIHYLFTDFEKLAEAMRDYLRPSYQKLYRYEPISGSLAERTRSLIQHRARLFETIAPTRRAALHDMYRVKSIAKEQRSFAKMLRGQVIITFAEELNKAPESLLETLDMLTSWETWERFRSWQKQTIQKTSDNLVKTILTILTSSSPKES